jgi:hypothetical protein
VSRRRLQVFLLIALAYIGLRLAAYLPSSIRTFPDSGTYVHTAEQSLTSTEFWAGWRPFTTPLLYRVLPHTETAWAAGQLVVSIGCWLALAGAVAWNVRRPGFRLVAFCLVLLFSLSVWITQWDRIILSDSLAVSLAAAVLAAWLALVRAPNVWTIAAVLATTLVWAFTRDSIAYMALLAVPFVLVWAALPGRRRGRIVLAVGLAAIFAANFIAQGSSASEPRRKGVMLNVIGARVLTNPDELRYFQDHGMPLPDVVRPLAGESLGTGPLRPDRPLASDPRVADFLSWVSDEGRQTLAAYLVTHPYRALKPVVEDAGPLLATDRAGYHEAGRTPLANYRAEGTDPLLPGPLAAVVYPPSVTAVLLWLAVIVAAAAWLASRGMARPLWLIPAAATLLQLPHAVVVWHGDTNEIARHALTVSVVTRLGLLVLTIFLVDAALEWRYARKSAIAGVSGAARYGCSSAVTSSWYAESAFTAQMSWPVPRM